MNSPFFPLIMNPAAWDSMLRRQLQERLGRIVHDSPRCARVGRGRIANTIPNTILNITPPASLPIAQHDRGGQLGSNIGVAGLHAYTGPPPPGYPSPPGYPPPPGYAYDPSTGVLIQGFQLTPANLIPVTLEPVQVSTSNVESERSHDLGQEVRQSENRSVVTAIDQLRASFVDAQSQEGGIEMVQGPDDKTEEMLSTYLERMKARRDELKSIITRPSWALMPVAKVHQTIFAKDEESQQLGASLEDFFNSPAPQTPSERSIIATPATLATPSVTWFEDFQGLLREADAEPTDEAAVDRKYLQPSTLPRLQPPKPLGDRPLPLFSTPSTPATTNRLLALTNHLRRDSTPRSLLSPIQEERSNNNPISATGSTTEEASSDHVTNESTSEAEITSEVANEEAIIETAIGTVPPTEFTRFSELKKHIRKSIWHFALPRARMIKLTKAPGAADIYSTAPVPAILQANRESRTLALRYYRLAFAPEGGIAKTYFDFSRDYLYTRCSGCFGPNCTHKQVLTDDHANVKYCAWEGPMSFNPFRKIFKFYPNLRGLVLLRGVSTVSRPGLICTADKCHPVAKHLGWFVDDIGWDRTPFE